MSEPFVSSRFLIVDKCHAYPYFDLHNQDPAGPVFDLGVDMDSYDGSVYLRPEYVIDMARTLGMATVEEVAEMRARIASLESQVNKLPSAQEELKNGIDNLIGEFYTRLNSVDSEPPVVEPEPAEDNREPAEAEREAIGPIIL